MASRHNSVLIRRDDEVGAMAWSQRVQTRVKNLFARTDSDDEALANPDVEASARPTRQYRVEGTRRTSQPGIFRRIITLNSCCSTHRANTGVSDSVNHNQSIAMYLHWMFRVNFVFLFIVMCNIFFALVILFSGFITLAGTMDSECVRVGNFAFGESGAPFADAFALSWTTMASVGYGITYPALAHQNTNRSHCFFINFVCSLEALIGVLYSGFCGAVLFGKVLRIQSHAQVMFSDPLLIRFGDGLSVAANAVSDDGATGVRCPVLEFRVVNKLFNEEGGEIVDASLNVVANINANDAEPVHNDAAERKRNTTATSMNKGKPTYFSSQASFDGSSDDGMSTRESHLGRIFGHNGHSGIIDEDPSARIVTKNIFSKMNIETSEHPFFRRVWVAKHVLDEHSPIVKNKVRRQIRRLGGLWPAKLNNAAAIRESLHFNQVLVSLTGVANVSAADVYAQKIYHWIDLNVGFQFVNILYRNSDGSLGIDTDLINDVREQRGGGGEPLFVE